MTNRLKKNTITFPVEKITMDVSELAVRLCEKSTEDVIFNLIQELEKQVASADFLQRLAKHFIVEVQKEFPGEPKDKIFKNLL